MENYLVVIILDHKYTFKILVLILRGKYCILLVLTYSAFSNVIILVLINTIS